MEKMTAKGEGGMRNVILWYREDKNAPQERGGRAEIHTAYSCITESFGQRAARDQQPLFFFISL